MRSTNSKPATNSLWTKSSLILHFFLVKKPFHLDIHHNREENTVPQLPFHADSKVKLDIDSISCSLKFMKEEITLASLFFLLRDNLIQFTKLHESDQFPGYFLLSADEDCHDY